MTPIDLPPTPAHPEPHAFNWSKAELRSIKAYARSSVLADRRAQSKVETAVLQPLTDDQIQEMCGDANRGFCIEMQDYHKAVRDTEAAHNISKPAIKETP